MHRNQETLHIWQDKLYSLADPSALPRVVLRKLLEFATKKSHFLFDGKYYNQIDVVAMGSPLGPLSGVILKKSGWWSKHQN